MKDDLDKIFDDFQFDTKRIRNNTTDFDSVEKVITLAAIAIDAAYKLGFQRGQK